MGDAKRQRFLEFVCPHERMLYALARQYAASAEEARDLFQEALLRAWRAFAKAPRGRYGGGWLAVILRRIAIDWHRRGRRRLRIVPVEEMELTDPSGPRPMSRLPRCRR